MKLAFFLLKCTFSRDAMAKDPSLCLLQEMVVFLATAVRLVVT